ncbi:phosphonate degradation HD-domain oxygenase [Achromobacter aloeverae]|uniref:Phosphohydrolase n=1 Tax=Achromobacter aloeverae TaxID=1750518 RepID=A0A4Q1HLW8_9BURK|nr:phosphonate degradation HD-domain oxygenase [Achromobacter aloeverae]RXN90157.1 phosphohydrolase [Achromobacter aloeverae]
MALDLQQIRALYLRYGDLSYSGEPVTQLEHALQCAALAEAEGASDELICAALLHDVGHLLNKSSVNPALPGTDDLHQYYGLPFLRSVFPDAVVEPIHLHVDAKRCLCAVDEGYFNKLTAGSVRSLKRQGGPLSEVEAAEFLRRPYAEDALRVRRWDDRAKVAHLDTPDLEHFLTVVSRVMKAPGNAAGLGNQPSR